MQKIGFAEALDSIVATDNRYSREAYVFLRDALNYITKQQKKINRAHGHHIHRIRRVFRLIVLS